jgi:hypothetical protein
MKATKSDGRVCSVCKKPGHNARTCPEKQKHETRATRKAQQQPESTALMTVGSVVEGTEGVTSTKSRSATSAPTTPSEFEEWTKQVVVPSLTNPELETTLRATLADYENGVISDVRLLIQESGSRQVPAMRLDMNVLEKLGELITTVIQRDRARRSQKQLSATHVNGKATTTATA